MTREVKELAYKFSQELKNFLQTNASKRDVEKISLGEMTGLSDQFILCKLSELQLRFEHMEKMAFHIGNYAFPSTKEERENNSKILKGEMK